MKDAYNSIIHYGALFLVLAMGVIGCSKYRETPAKDSDAAWIAHSSYVCTKVVEIEGHRYVIVKGHVYCGDSVSIVHAESCPCKKGQSND